MTSDNPAARLLTMLEAAKKIPASENSKVAWKKIFDIDDIGIKSESILMAKLGQFMLLPYETQNLMLEHYPAQAKDLQHTISKLQAAIANQNLSGQWTTFISHIDPHCISALSMTTALLDHKLKTKLIDFEQLDSFKIKIQSLIDGVIITDLDTDFKKYITHYLQKILTAMNDYLISGAVPILDALEATLGHAVLDPNFKDNLKETETGQKVSDFIGDLANVVTVAAAATSAVAYIASNGVPLLG